MPFAAMRPCLGCGQPCKKPRCQTCAKAYERGRLLSYHGWYTSQAWRDARRRFLYAHPLCRACAGVTSATVVDHIVPHKGNHALFWNEANWQPLCKFHHDRKTTLHDGGLGR